MDKRVKEIEAPLSRLSYVAEYLIEVLPEDAIVFLRGDLAAGKTTLMQEIARCKGVASEVTSPTFSLQHCYGDDLYHYDLYRLEHEEFMQMGLFEEFGKPGWHMVEWGSDALKAFLEGVGYNVITINIDPIANGRRYRISQ